MRRFFTGLAALVLLAMGALHAARFFVPWRLVVEGEVVPPMISVFAGAALIFLAIAVLFEMRAAGRASEPAVTRGGETRSFAGPTRAKAATVKQGRRYRAEIQLSWFEQAIATNEYIAEQLTSVGFTDVSVTGTGSRRIAEGLWPHKDQTAEMPTQIVQTTEIQTPSTQVASAS